MKHTPFFIFDVESIGLHGEAFAVAGGVYIDGKMQSEFLFSCSPDKASGEDSDRDWVENNIVELPETHETPSQVRNAFVSVWEHAKQKFPDILTAAECAWPVEANFLSKCAFVKRVEIYRRGLTIPIEEKIESIVPREGFEGPYPLHDISTFMLAAGMDPMKTYDRLESELPKHHPLADARQSARLLFEAIGKLRLSDTHPVTGTCS